ncbi:hypothetical protein MANAM107_20140 [Actinomyces capricornis]|uniref:Uncharacterized protein n=1 Tax=Actinomyces capricornis TaxID=2755559 RepID=A0ABN6K6R4_9ACTO|nr:hypothetical protein MANAM107_20140 [Actinomyces capricornis]
MRLIRQSVTGDRLPGERLARGSPLREADPSCYEWRIRVPEGGHREDAGLIVGGGLEEQIDLLVVLREC